MTRFDTGGGGLRVPSCAPDVDQDQSLDKNDPDRPVFVTYNGNVCSAELRDTGGGIETYTRRR